MGRLPQSLEMYLAESADELKELIFTLCAIPAPSHHEEKRAEFCLEWLRRNGIADAYIDPALNVVWPYRADGDGLLLMSAHTDTVFPDETPFTVKVSGDVAACPGIGDDTANLAELMMLMRYVAREKPETECGILFVCNSCEEGLGNLKGMRQLFSDFSGRIAAHISLDGSTNSYAVHAVGSKRYRVSVETEGGHSWGAFGNRNAIEKLAALIVRLYQIKVPEIEGQRTTYNVGTVSGGTSVNTIAQHAEMLFEFRSTCREGLKIMEDLFLQELRATEADCLSVKAELLGERPCDGDIDEKAHAKLIRRVSSALEEINGKPVAAHSSSTDCNIPLSLGIPAVCFGGRLNRGTHTYEEQLFLSSLKPGFRAVALVLSSFFTIK